MWYCDPPSLRAAHSSWCVGLPALWPDLEWKVLYVGSAEDVDHDQVLEEVMVGPVPVGINKFVLQVRDVSLAAFQLG